MSQRIYEARIDWRCSGAGARWSVGVRDRGDNRVHFTFLTGSRIWARQGIRLALTVGDLHCVQIISPLRSTTYDTTPSAMQTMMIDRRTVGLFSIGLTELSDGAGIIGRF